MGLERNTGFYMMKARVLKLKLVIKYWFYERET